MAFRADLRRAALSAPPCAPHRSSHRLRLALVLLASVFAAASLGRAANARVLRAHTIEVRTISDTTALQWFAENYDFALLYEMPVTKGYLQAQIMKQYNPNMKVVAYKDSHALLPGITGWNEYNGNYPGIQTQLASAIGATDMTIQLVNAAAFPTANFWIKVNSETIEIASRSGNALTVKNYGGGYTGRGIATIRTVDGGSWAAASHSAGAQVYLPREDLWLHDQTTGSRFYYAKYGWYHLDVSNPKLQQYWAQEALTWITTYYNASSSGLDPAGPHLDGIFADDCWIDIAYAQNTDRMTRVKDAKFGTITQAKVDSFHSDMVNFLKVMKQTLGSHILIANSGGGVSQDYVDVADGCMHEQWMHAAWWQTTTDPSESNWLANIQSMQTVSAKGKYYLAQDNLNVSGLPAGRDTQVLKFGFASYLLATNDVHIDQTKTSFRHRPYLDTTQSSYYTKYYYGWYDFDPGRPLGPYYVYYQDKTKGITVYARDYTNVVAFVNPSGSNSTTNSALDVTISLRGTFRELLPDDTQGPAVTTLLLRNKYGAVMVRTAPVGASNVSLQETIDRPGAGPGGIVAYSFTYKNSGTVLAPSFAITDSLPGVVTFVPGSARLNGVAVTPDPISSDGRTVRITIGDLAPGVQGAFSFQVQVQ